MALGVSKESYSHSELYPIYGSGQGDINHPPFDLSLVPHYVIYMSRMLLELIFLVQMAYT
eukprot:13312844-Ditylum_brightwellii.AAC.1